MDDREAERTVAAAIEAGYRLIDTAENYGNERGVGRGIRASGVDRSDVFVTTKLNGRWHGFDESQQAFDRSAERLGLERIDLFLIHSLPARDRYVDAWRGLVRLHEEGRVRAIGVSNFTPAHLDRLVRETGIAPHVNQVQLNPWIPRADERRHHDCLEILTESWGPIGQGGRLLRDPAIVDIAGRRSRTPAQVVLRWHVQAGLVPIPKTSRPERLRENLDVFGFELTDEEVRAISRLDRRGAGAVDADRVGH